MPEKLTMTPGEYADRLGVTTQALRNAARAHALPWQPGDISVPVPAMDAAWTKLYREGKVKTPPVAWVADDADADEDEEGGGEELESAKLRRAIAQADIDEAKAAKLAGELVPVADVLATWERITSVQDAMFDAIPARLAARLPGNPRETIRVVREELATMRRALSEQVEADAIEAEEAARLALEVEAAPPPAPVRRAR